MGVVKGGADRIWLMTEFLWHGLVMECHDVLDGAGESVAGCCRLLRLMLALARLHACDTITHLSPKQKQSCNLWYSDQRSQAKTRLSEGCPSLVPRERRSEGSELLQKKTLSPCVSMRSDRRAP